MGKAGRGVCFPYFITKEEDYLSRLTIVPVGVLFPIDYLVLLPNYLT